MRPSKETLKQLGDGRAVSTSARVIPTSTTSSRRCASAYPRPPRSEGALHATARTGSKPTTTRISHTPGDRSRNDPVPRGARRPSSLYGAPHPPAIGARYRDAQQKRTDGPAAGPRRVGVVATHRKRRIEPDLLRLDAARGSRLAC